jgi:hypothetical protein
MKRTIGILSALALACAVGTTSVRAQEAYIILDDEASVELIIEGLTSGNGIASVENDDVWLEDRDAAAALKVTGGLRSVCRHRAKRIGRRWERFTMQDPRVPRRALRGPPQRWRGDVFRRARDRKAEASADAGRKRGRQHTAGASALGASRRPEGNRAGPQTRRGRRLRPQSTGRPARRRLRQTKHLTSCSSELGDEELREPRSWTAWRRVGDWFPVNGERTERNPRNGSGPRGRRPRGGETRRGGEKPRGRNVPGEANPG